MYDRCLFGFNDGITGAGNAGRKLNVKNEYSYKRIHFMYIHYFKLTPCCCVGRIEMPAESVANVNVGAAVVGAIASVGEFLVVATTTAGGPTAGVSVSVDSPKRFRYVRLPSMETNPSSSLAAEMIMSPPTLILPLLLPLPYGFILNVCLLPALAPPGPWIADSVTSKISP